MKKTSFLNIVIIILMIIVAVSSVQFIGNSREWFSKTKKEDEFSVTAPLVEGSVSVIRRGAGYTLKEGIGLTAGDEVISSAGASAVLDFRGAGTVTLDEESEMALSGGDNASQTVFAKSGCFYFDIDPSSVAFAVDTFWGRAAIEESSVFSLEMRHGTQTLRVYKGGVTVKGEAAEEPIAIAPGQQLVVLQDDDGNSVFLELSDISPKSMSDFLLEKTLSSGSLLCFSADELRSEADRRAKEVEDAKAAREEYEKQVIARGGTVPVVVIPQSSSPGSYALSCTISIRCDTVLSHMNMLAPGKSSSVPSNGVILYSTRVEFSEGENVYDVLRRVCSYAGIPLQYSYTVAYGGYYIEGINDLCEFDCGPQSGWMYKVNGWFPNYGCMYYILSDGDDIVWAYSCEGLGADIGAAFSY